ncbi:MAG: leucine-rich repeat protein, partial [Firmicutes bacterium]|nr:leucine-rich repeat protein [Bacillota bacterium]
FDFANVAVDEIAELLFAECGSLANVNLGNVKTISNQAFLSCTALTKIVIPVSVDVIGNYVFSACNSLKEIFIEDTDPDGLAIGGFEPFGSATNVLQIFVSTESVAAKFQADLQYAIYKDLITAKP